MNEVSSFDVLSWYIHCLSLLYRKIMPFWWKDRLWINLHLIHLQDIRTSHWDYFHTHTNMWFNSFWLFYYLLHNYCSIFFPLTYFLSITIGYSPPGYCCCFASIVFKSQKRDWELMFSWPMLFCVRMSMALLEAIQVTHAI